MKNITSKKEFLELKKSLGVRDDWHEPDEQGVTVNMIMGSKSHCCFQDGFDNAFCNEREHHIIIMKNSKPVASVNLALLCAWASGLKD